MNSFIRQRYQWKPIQQFTLRNIRVYAEGLSFKQDVPLNSHKLDDSLGEHKIESSIGELEDQTITESFEKPVYTSMHEEHGEVSVRFLYD